MSEPSSNPTNECIICYQAVDTPSSLDCTHVNIFHEECLNRWGKGRCPLCQARQLLARRVTNVQRTEILLGMPDDLLYKQYETYGERMRTFLDWMLEHCDSTTRDQTEMLNDSVTHLTEEDYCFIRTYDPPSDRGFMFSKEPVVRKIMQKVDEGFSGHSGASIGWTLRFIQFVVCDCE